MIHSADVIILGAGIAGSSLAFELACDLNVVLLELEETPGYHSTGRSAAMLTETYGHQVIRRLTRVSRNFFEDPPEGFVDTPLLEPRGILHVAREEQLDALDAAFVDTKILLPSIERLDGQELVERAPLVDPAYAAGGMLEADAGAIDVAAFHQAYLKGYRHRGGHLVTDAALSHVCHRGSLWQIDTAAGRFNAKILVNATGAWADQIAILADIPAIGLIPKRRTGVMIDLPSDLDNSSLPMIIDIDEEFYVKPEGSGLMLSPADETPVAPSDVQPEELDVALAIDHFITLSRRPVPRINYQWAGLRSFVKDRSPVVGFDPIFGDFFWLAAQGGFGIMTAPAIAKLARALIIKTTAGKILDDLAPALDPARLHIN